MSIETTSGRNGPQPGDQKMTETTLNLTEIKEQIQFIETHLETFAKEIRIDVLSNAQAIAVRLDAFSQFAALTIAKRRYIRNEQNAGRSVFTLRPEIGKNAANEYEYLTGQYSAQ
jgi:3-dehydroquinate dehydratase